ncbi:hypothetical protein MCANUFG1_00613 [Mycoplasmopsis canis UFG1]|uniref:hypothetical protein n=1 Tax=Mycoplasmopsis canis TaxID=29555 RepID=UPI00025B0B51|nr:hypothetical protein [Mycoplasmopsis canis]EIE42095.1 hypothetical protein MCANUFG1_00613 [Mycoplasmopsis canis UFG1]
MEVKPLTKYEKKKFKHLNYIIEHPNDSNEYLAKKFKVSTRTITRYRTFLKQNPNQNLNEIKHGNRKIKNEK